MKYLEIAPEHVNKASSFMEELLVFQSFAAIEDAENLAGLFEEKGIRAKVETLGPKLDKVFIGNEYINNYEVRIAAADFAEANKLLYSRDLDAIHVDSSHPLYGMTNDELKEIIARRDEWGADNYHVAKSLLKSRGLVIPEQVIEQLQEERIGVLAEKKSMSMFLIVLGWLVPLVPLVRNMTLRYPEERYGWYFPAFLGFAIGLVPLVSKNTLPDGRQVATFDNKTIERARWIMTWNLLSWAINIILFIFGMF